MSTDQTPALARAARDLCLADTDTQVHELSHEYPCTACVEEAETAVSAALHDPSVTHVLALHQVESHGMGPSTPDGCACGERVMPAPHQSEYEDISSRRGRAFAEHQAAALVAAILGEAS